MEVVPPGFRFHPTEEELVGYYLQRKVTDLKIDLDVITEIDLYRMEPWDIEGKCKLGYEEQSEWYFFSHKDRKYPTGTRTNRATGAGFWKATGRDKAVLSKERLIGMRKTLVFYKGRAPNGMKSDWIMHEYRLQTSEHGPPQEEGWVVCRAFKKPTPSHMQGFRSCNSGYYIRDNYRPMSYPSTSNIMQTYNDPLNQGTHYQLTSTLNSGHNPFESQMVDLPKLDSPSFSTSFATKDDSLEHSLVASDDVEDDKGHFGNQYSDWKSFDKLLGPQVFGESSSSFEYTNMALETHTDVLASQNHMNSVLDCFPHDL